MEIVKEYTYNNLMLHSKVYDKISLLTMNAKILIIGMYDLARLFAVRNKVTYLTIDKDKCDLFNSTINKYPEKYNNDDVGILMNSRFENLENEIGNMQFDYIIGNPPYNGNLHLKILDKVYKHLDLTGKLVWIHPCRWCTDLSWYTKKHTDIEKYFHLPFQKFEFINMFKCNQIFKINLFGDGLVITSIDNTKKAYYKTIEDLVMNLKEEEYDSKLILPIFNKIKNKMNHTLADKIKIGNMIDKKFAFPIKKFFSCNGESLSTYLLISSNHGIYENGKYNDKSYGENRHQARNKDGKINYKTETPYLSFNTKEEAENCYNSFKTIFYRFITKLFNNTIKSMPYMEDYTQPWTDERFYKYFDLTIDEQKEIERIMKPYC